MGFLMHSFVCVFGFGPVKGSDEREKEERKDEDDFKSMSSLNHL